MAITYNAGTNTITVVGYTVGMPCTFLDIYNADVAGGWGQVTKHGSGSFFFQCFLVLGDGSTTTYFTDKDAYVYFEKSGNWVQYIKVNNLTYFTLGELVDASKKSTRRGCVLAHNATDAPKRIINILHGGAICKFYSTIFANGGSYRGFAIYGDGAATVPDVTLYNCSALMVGLSRINTDIYNYTLTGDATVNSTYAFYQTQGTMDGIVIRNVVRPIYAGYSYPMTVKNMNLYDFTEIGVISLAIDVYLINCDIETWHFNNNDNQGGKIYRQYEFDLKVIDKDNVAINSATVKIWDKDSALVVDTTTNASGVIATQTLNYGYYTQPGGDTPVMKTPHLIKIEKAGYTMYEADFTLEEKTDWTIALQTSILRNPSMTGGMV